MYEALREHMLKLFAEKACSACYVPSIIVRLTIVTLSPILQYSRIDSQEQYESNRKTRRQSRYGVLFALLVSVGLPGRHGPYDVVDDAWEQGSGNTASRSSRHKRV